MRDYNLEMTLASGQAFRWQRRTEGWESVLGPYWVRLVSREDGIVATTAVEIPNWDWLAAYLQVGVDQEEILRSFPIDEPMQAAVAACRGLRLLRQDPWECLASFILSSTKQIVQIQQIVRLLCERFGDPVSALNAEMQWHSFPSARRLAECSEADLRDCKMGFRAPYLRGAAAMVAQGEVNLESLYHLPLEEARERLLQLPGVGRKIADCVLLFAYGFQAAFPIDVWVMKGLQELYFKRRRVKPERLQRFSQSHFGPNAGYAQQYLFHYMRTRGKL